MGKHSILPDVDTIPAEQDHPMRLVFEGFFKLNPESSLIIERKQQKVFAPVDRFLIEKPWGDDSLVIALPDAFDMLVLPIAQLFNKIRLPLRFSGVVHVEENKFEFIYGRTVEDGDVFKKLMSVDFFLVHKGKKIRCWYDASSEAAECVYKHLYSGLQESNTNFRDMANMFRGISSLSKNINQQSLIDSSPYGYYNAINKNLSFFVKSDSFIDEEEMVEIAKQINIALNLRAGIRTKIVIHDNALLLSSFWKEEKKMPSEVSSIDLDEGLHSLWNHLVEVEDDIGKILNSFRIIEYVSHDYMREEVVKDIKASFAKYSQLSDGIDDFISSIPRIVYSGEDTTEYVRRRNVIKSLANVKRIFEFVHKNKSIFSKKMIFDGGLEIQAIIENRRVVDPIIWWENRHKDVVSGINNLRNALAHGKESDKIATFWYTPKNLVNIKPWSRLCIMLAEDLILSKS